MKKLIEKIIESDNLIRNENNSIYFKSKESFIRFLNKYSDKLNIIQENSDNEFRFIIIDSKKKIIDRIEYSIQIHNKKDRDIMIDSRKLSDNSYNIKLIYHRMKDNKKEFRIFISFKDKNKKLKRFRLRNQTINEIQYDEKKMREYYQKISKKDIEKSINF